jgi:hypothetical protein
MNLKVVVATVAVLGLSAAGWFYRDAGPVASAVQAVGARTGGSTPLTAPTLQAAGVHKCRGTGGIAYLDGPCPPGSHELAANGGTMTVTSFPRPVPTPSALASSAFGGPLVKPLSPEERDRLRDRQIEAAANRP